MILSRAFQIYYVSCTMIIVQILQYAYNNSRVYVIVFMGIHFEKSSIFNYSYFKSSNFYTKI